MKSFFYILYLAFVYALFNIFLYRFYCQILSTMIATSYDKLLHIVQSSPKINSGNVLLECERMLKKLKVQELIDSGVHRYAITHTKRGDWQTHVTVDSKRKIITGRSEEAFYNALYEFYFGERNRATMASLFNEWIEERQRANLSPRTINRYQDSYKKYLEGTELDTT